MRFTRGFHTLALAGFGAAFLSSCSVAVEEGPTRTRPVPPRPAPVACTMEYNPVCGERGGQQRTFGNACSARAEGFLVVHAGECRGNVRPPVMQPQPPRPPVTQPQPPRPPVTQPQPPRPPVMQPQPPRLPQPGQQACTREFVPVCGERGGAQKTFPNACEANRASYRIVHQGECGPVRPR